MSLVRAGTRWRRFRIYYPSPGCRQGTILAPVAAWRRLPGSGGTWPLDILVCSAARWPPRTTSSRASGRTIRAHEQAAETAPPGPPGHGPADHGDHGDQDRPRRSRPVTVVTAGHGGHGRPRPNVSDGVTADAANAALANDTVARPIRVNERANGRIERPTPPGTRPRGYGPAAGGADGRIERPAPPGTRPRSRRSRPPKAERSGAGSRPRRHGDHGEQASPGSRPLVALPLPITPSHGSHGASRRARRARREPWVLSPPGARGRADLPGDRAAAGGRGPPIPKGGRAGKENRFDRITFCLETCDERPLPLMSRNGYVPASESPADGWD